MQGLFTIPLSIMRVVPLIIFFIKSKLAGTERAKARCWNNQLITYGVLTTNDMMAMLFGFSFCVISPIIAPVVVVYFAMRYLIWKHQMVYVFRQEYQSGGQVRATPTGDGREWKHGSGSLDWEELWW